MRTSFSEECPRPTTFVAAPSLTCSTLPLRISKHEVPLFVNWEQFVPAYLPSVVNVTFVQVGANCGKNTRLCAKGGDPIWTYAERCGWRGVAVEPVTATFLELCRNYAATTPWVRPLRALITDKAVMDRVSLMGETSTGLRLERERLALQNRSVPVSDKTSEPVVGLTLRDIWPAEGAAVLVVDVEGSEVAVLGRHRLPHPAPNLVLFESAQLPPSHLQQIDENLVRQGFNRVADLKHRDRYGKKMPPQDRLYGRQRTQRRY